MGALVRENHGLIENVTGINLTVSGTIDTGGVNLGVGGIVGLNYGTLSNVTANVNVSGAINVKHIGGLVGRQGRVGLELSGFLLNCSVSGTVTRLDGSTTEAASTGGAVGLMELGGITNTHAAVTVVSPLSRTGGLAGTSQGPIAGSSASGSVTSAGHSVGGLVGLNHGSIQESFSMSNVSGTAYVGGLVGLAEGLSDVSNSHATGNVQGSQYVGGLCGRNGRVISTSYATGDVEGEKFVGGLVGYHRVATASITRSWASGAASASGDDVGGLVGLALGQIDASYARGVVTGAKNVGGLAGRVEVDAVIRGCASTASIVSGVVNVGGLVGNLVGVAERCFATGDVTGESQVGGFVGILSGSTIDSYATGEVRADVTKGGGFAGQLRPAPSSCARTQRAR